MPPRVCLPSQLTPSRRPLASLITARAYSAAAAKYASSIPNPVPANLPISHHAPTQPPSHRAAESRKTQLHRTYLSILRSTPVMLVFQHNNVRAVEWTALRREVAVALNKLSPGTDLDPVAQGIRITMLQGAIFSAAMRVAEYYDPSNGSLHGTSKEAYEQTKKRKKHPIAPIVAGPVGIVTFPVASPEHLKTVMAVMFPESGRAARGMDPLAGSGLQKLVLLAARVDGHVAAGKVGAGQVMEVGKVKWLSTLPELEGLRGQLVAILQTTGGGDLARSLEAIPTGVVRTLDAHRKILNGELEQDSKM